MNVTIGDVAMTAKLYGRHSAAFRAAVDAFRDQATDCVGFAECPCAKHRASRLAATAAHPDHSTTDRGLCGVCRTAARQEDRYPHGTRVTHPRYGEGTIESDHGSLYVDVAFSHRSARVAVSELTII